jgi:hypothetical protein
LHILGVLPPVQQRLLIAGLSVESACIAIADSQALNNLSSKYCVVLRSGLNLADLSAIADDH